MSKLLQDKVVIVTGAASGIGRAIAISAARHGAKAVLVSDIAETPREGGTPTTQEIEALGVATRFVRADVSKKADVDAVAPGTIDTHLLRTAAGIADAPKAAGSAPRCAALASRPRAGMRWFDSGRICPVM